VTEPVLNPPSADTDVSGAGADFLDPATLTDAELQAEIAARKQQITLIGDQLAADALREVRRPIGWQRRAEDARRHLKRERGLLVAEQQRRDQQRRLARKEKRVEAEVVRAAAKAQKLEAESAAAKAKAALRLAEAECRKTLDRCFVDAAHELLPPDQCARIRRRAKEIASAR